MKEKTDIDQQERPDKEQNNQSPLNGRSALFSRDWTGTIGTKRQTYHIYVDLIAKLRGYAYWEQRKISEVVNCALEQFFANKEVKPRPPKNASSEKK